jgi:hypothetical protein
MLCGILLSSIYISKKGDHFYPAADAARAEQSDDFLLLVPAEKGRVAEQIPNGIKSRRIFHIDFIQT